MFLSIRLSSGDKPDSPGVMASSTSLRSARIEPGFQPNNVRNARTSQFSPPSRAGGTGTGRLRGSNGRPPAELDAGESLSGMAISRCQNRDQNRAQDKDRAFSWLS